MVDNQADSYQPKYPTDQEEVAAKHGGLQAHYKGDLGKEEGSERDGYALPGRKTGLISINITVQEAPSTDNRAPIPTPLAPLRMRKSTTYLKTVE